MSKQKKNIQKNKPKPAQQKKLVTENQFILLPWMLLVAGITAICMVSMLKNEFTNWDDEFYVINNTLLRGPDWKGIFSEPVVGNYHPLTVITLAFNYALSSTDPFSYLLVNYLLHIINSLLVFYFIWQISDKNKFIAAFTALVFGIHPMHVESVAWVSERKDVLYTLFFLLAMIQYWRFLANKKRSNFWICFLFFVLSLLSKPAAVILPLVLLLLDYWKGRPITSKVILEKIPFFLLSLLLGIITVKIQTPTALAGLDVFSITDRMLFACYTLMIYFARFFVPYPLSAYHPFPNTSDPGLAVLLSPVFVIALLAFLWFMRRNKIIVFGFLFYIINLLLVLQVISIGLTIVSERYTYMPYIGLAFMVGMLLNKYKILPVKLLWAVSIVFFAILGFVTFQRTQVWRNSGVLWTDVINTYPQTTYPRTNRANYISIQAEKENDSRVKDSLYRSALEDCNIALSIKSNLAAGYEKRGLIYLSLNMLNEAFADAESLVKLDPRNKSGYDVRGSIHYRRNEPGQALENYNRCIELDPDNHRYYSNRASIYINFYNKYQEALADITKAISINPLGSYYLSRSICYYKMGDMVKAREDALIAIQKGSPVDAGYRSLIQLQ